jgi:hypothetical protein
VLHAGSSFFPLHSDSAVLLFVLLLLLSGALWQLLYMMNLRILLSWNVAALPLLAVLPVSRLLRPLLRPTCQPPAVSAVAAFMPVRLVLCLYTHAARSAVCCHSPEASHPPMHPTARASGCS